MNRRCVWLAFLLLPWLIVLAVPSLRLMLVLQLRGSDVAIPAWRSSGSFGGPRFSAQALAERQPPDVRVLAQLAEEESFEQKLRCRRYDQLIKQFPDAVWLVAHRLIVTTHWLRDNRIAGSLEYVPGMAPRQNTFTPAELEQATAMARQARRLEPDNAFFDWMLAQFLFSAHRDVEALAVLHDGSLKARYDDHTLDHAAVQIAVRELVRPLSIEEKTTIVGGMILPHLSAQRHTMHLAAYQGRMAQARGDHQRALTIYSDLARLGALQTRGHNFILTGWSGATYQSTAWHGLGQRITKEQLAALGMPATTASWVKVYARRFAAYGQAHGRPDLAHEALELAQETARFCNLTRGDAPPLPLHFGIPIRRMALVSSLSWLGALLSLQAGLSGALWILLGAGLWSRREAAPVVRRGAVTGGVMACGLLVAALSGSAIWFGAGWGEAVGPRAFFGDSLLPETVVLALSLLALTVPAWGGIVCGLGAAIWRGIKAMWRGSRKPVTSPHESETTPAHLPRDPLPVFRVLLGVTALLTAGCSWLALYWPSEFDVLPGVTIDNPIQTFTWPVSITALCLVGWAIAWRWLTPPSQRSGIRSGLHWYRQTLGIWLMLIGWIYLLLAVASLPARRVAAADLDNFIQRGEIATAGLDR